jgi:hypothetical protein
MSGSRRGSGSLLCRLSSLLNRGLLLRLLGHRYLLEPDIFGLASSFLLTRSGDCDGCANNFAPACVNFTKVPLSWSPTGTAVELLDVDAAVLHNLETRISKLSTLKQQFQCRAQDIV